MKNWNFLCLSLLLCIIWILPQDQLYSQEKAIEIVGTDVKNKDYKISDLTGKVVYIDVWASWCGPCKKEIPHLKELKSKFRDQNDKIAFVGISIDDSPSSWQKAIKKYKLDGLQLIDLKKKITKDYKIYGIPRFILIGKKGELLLNNAPRPSSGKLIEKMLRKAIAG